MSPQSHGIEFKDSEISESVKIFARAEIIRSKIKHGSSVGNDTNIIDSSIEEYVSLNRRNYIFKSELGRFSYTGIGTMIFSAKIGKFCSISWNVSIGGGNHEYDNISTSPLWRFRKMIDDKSENLLNSDLQKRLINQPNCGIGNDVWIASNVVVLRGVEIGDGAVIGAGAVVTKNVEPYSIVTGVPARIRKKRFDDNTIQSLLNIKWWNWPEQLIKENVNLIFSSKVNQSILDNMQRINESL